MAIFVIAASFVGFIVGSIVGHPVAGLAWGFLGSCFVCGAVERGDTL